MIASDTKNDKPTRSELARIRQIRAVLPQWYLESGRNFPWRSETASGFERIVCEILLQQTTAIAVAAFYPDFFGRYSCWEDLADAETDELENTLRPIGLWRRRAKSLKRLGKQVSKLAGKLPVGHRELQELPAVGPYVASAIQLFAQGRSAPLLDAGFARVVERSIRTRRLADIRCDPFLWHTAVLLIDSDAPIYSNWALLDIAGMYCRPREPRCNECPIANYCRYGRALG